MKIIMIFVELVLSLRCKYRGGCVYDIFHNKGTPYYVRMYSCQYCLSCVSFIDKQLMASQEMIDILNGGGIR